MSHPTSVQIISYPGMTPFYSYIPFYLSHNNKLKNFHCIPVCKKGKDEIFNSNV